MYATTASLLTRFSAEEIAQRSDRGVPRLVSAELLAAAVAGASMDAYSADEQAAAIAAQGVIERALQDADSTIDGYLAARYPVPFASPPAIVDRLACDMARYFLYDDQATDAVQKRYDAALAYFRDVAAGRASLGPDVQSDSPASAGSIEVTGAPTVWGRDRSRGFI